ncbi:hypothetical protein IU427_31940 [Nocardia beijingensis]|uniref:hypothetical protein n=1 Tax=Nocardia beijingensis TaxID=95162 RepID=UPI001895305A|nr:hypothetical protein [Nocardia beijingensis]MBF6469739.1 hypothetical protein [Nocardia beijingensis]
MGDTARRAETLQALLRDGLRYGVLQQPVGAVPATDSGVAHGSVDAAPGGGEGFVDGAGAQPSRDCPALGAGRRTRPGINPKVALLEEIALQRRALRRYRTWLDNRAA